MSQFTELLREAETGSPAARDRLYSLVYDELRRLAAEHLAREQPGHTLQPTALVHEAYLRLFAGAKPTLWNGRGHFFSAAARAVRHILIDAARKKRSAKRGGGFVRKSLDAVPPVLPEPREDLLALDDALRKFATVQPRAAELVQLLYFAGLTIPEAARVLAISPRTAGRWWTYARAWLRREVEGSPRPGKKS